MQYVIMLCYYKPLNTLLLSSTFYWSEAVFAEIHMTQICHTAETLIPAGI